LIQKDVTLLLQAVCSGDQAAYSRLYEAVYAELRHVAAANMRRESPGHTLQPTALVHEAYLRLAPGLSGLENRRHFFGAAAEAMRRILVDHARQRLAGKRGAGLERVTLSGLDVPADEEGGADVLDIDAALTELGRERPRLAELVKLRYFAGMSIEEAAEAQGTSPATAKRDWAFARAWLAERVESRRGA
jgi:RNA polymerase sigma factor (TIGR02999 family)